MVSRTLISIGIGIGIGIDIGIDIGLLLFRNSKLAKIIIKITGG